ncbi:hypothetical protein ACIP6P_17915 [Streptomyces sp. NPDC088729]|uniref:hypothetical protein n=1 Tax=Streptomyces sp. NPDC088729 TaxID=3365876 RepID=UPI0037F2CC13
MNRVVYPLCFDSQHRVLLVPDERPDAGGTLTLPMVRCQEAESYTRASRRLLSGHAVRKGDVVARVRTISPEGQPREARLCTAHATAPADGREGQWIPWPDAVQFLKHLALPDLDVFIEGYLGGWIPNGWITLDA